MDKSHDLGGSKWSARLERTGQSISLTTSTISKTAARLVLDAGTSLVQGTYDLVVSNAFGQTSSVLVTTLKGDTGAPGPQGPSGAVGPQGSSGAERKILWQFDNPSRVALPVVTYSSPSYGKSSYLLDLTTVASMSITEIRDRCSDFTLEIQYGGGTDRERYLFPAVKIWSGNSFPAMHFNMSSSKIPVAYSSSERMVLSQALSQLDIKLAQSSFTDGSNKIRLFRSWAGEGSGSAICFMPTFKIVYHNGSQIIEGTDTVSSPYSSNHSACDSAVNRTIGRDFSSQPALGSAIKVYPSKILVSGLCK